MVGENFDFWYLKCQKMLWIIKNQTSPQGRNQKIQIPHQNHFSPGTLKSDFPPDKTLSKILISPQNFREKWHYAFHYDSIYIKKLGYWDQGPESIVYLYC